MATGREDIEMTDARNYPLPENYDRDIGETSLSNPSFEGNNEQYPIGDRSNLIDELSPAPAPRLSLMVKSMIINSNHDKLDQALGGSKWAGKDWGPNSYTYEGVYVLSERCKFSGINNNILHIKGADGEYIKDRYSGQIYNFLTNDLNKRFKAYKTLHGRIDLQSLNYINEILTTPENIKEAERYNTSIMSDRDKAHMFAPYRISASLAEHMAEQRVGVREPGDNYVTPGDDVAPSATRPGAGAQQPDGATLRLTSVTPTPIFDAVIRDMNNQNTEGFINNLIGAPEEELIAKGFTANTIGELRELKRSGVNLAAMQREKHLVTEELKGRIEGWGGGELKNSKYYYKMKLIKTQN